MNDFNIHYYRYEYIKNIPYCPNHGFHSFVKTTKKARKKPGGRQTVREPEEARTRQTNGRRGRRRRGDSHDLHHLRTIRSSGENEGAHEFPPGKAEIQMRRVQSDLRVEQHLEKAQNGASFASHLSVSDGRLREGFQATGRHARSHQNR